MIKNQHVGSEAMYDNLKKGVKFSREDMKKN